ncbi:MAG: flagellar basal body P-ring protein FlgI [Rhodobacteraceae bacterium]|nr:flagellar basal body P-ring protein FlgI [Paracoccaceae bacterium]
MRWLIACFVSLACLCGPASADARIKDIAVIRGPQDNQLFGYGLVIGLQGTGDSLRNVPFLGESLRAMLDRMGIRYGDSLPRTKNIAAVAVTAKLPPFVGKGAQLDVNVSSLGDASSLLGGTLVLTPLYGANRKIYAVAQGPLTVTGFAKEGEAQSVSQGIPTNGRIPNGAIVEREVRGSFSGLKDLKLELRNADFDTAIAVTDAINRFTRKKFRKRLALEKDARTIAVKKPKGISTARFAAIIGQLRVRPDNTAKVVVDESTGTVVIGANVKVSTVAVTHGNLTVRITERPQVSQPQPFSEGQTAVEPNTRINASEPDGQFALLQGTDLDSLTAGLNAIGLKPSGIISILQAIKTSGALHAELVVQ